MNNRKFIVWKNIADVFIEMGKLVFGGFVLGGILSGEANWFVLVAAGGVGCVVAIGLGILIRARLKIK
jgi:hypothetical protein